MTAPTELELICLCWIRLISEWVRNLHTVVHPVNVLLTVESLSPEVVPCWVFSHHGNHQTCPCHMIGVFSNFFTLGEFIYKKSCYCYWLPLNKYVTLYIPLSLCVKYVWKWLLSTVWCQIWKSSCGLDLLQTNKGYLTLHSPKQTSSVLKPSR